MSNTYSDLIYTNYPDDCDSYEYMQDLTSDLLQLVNEYEALINTKKFAEATQLLKDNPQLNRIYFNAEKYNKIIDSIKAVQRFYSTDIRKYILELMNYKGDYSNTIKYIRYNVVRYNSMIYLCILDCPLGTLPTNTQYWLPLTIKGDTGQKGDDGLGLHFSKAWSSSATYSKDAAVSYGSALYASTVDNNKGHTPSINSAYWNLVINFDDIIAYDNSSTDIACTTMQEAIDYTVNQLKAINNTVASGNVHSAEYDSGGYHIHNTFDQLIQSIDGKLSTSASCNKNWNWSGKNGQPAYVWGGEDGINMYVYSPANFNVNHSKTADSATTASNCTGNSATATYATTAGSASANGGNSDTVNGYNFQVSSTSINTGSTLATNTIYIQYE